MIQITKVIEWDMGHRVPNHRSKCRNPHGHRYRLELTVAGPICEAVGESDEGMVMDLGDVKAIMREAVHDVLDHGFMVHEDDTVMRRFFETNADQEFRVIIVPFVPTVERISEWCGRQLRANLPAGLDIVNVRVFETPNSWADYRPDPDRAGCPA